MMALYCGAALFLAGRAAFLRITAGAVPVAPLLVAAVALMLMPAARYLPALAALCLVTVLVAALAGYEGLDARNNEAVAGNELDHDRGMACDLLDDGHDDA